VIVNLQKTPLEKYASMNVFSKCDEFVQKVMGYLEIPIPQFILKRKVVVEYLKEKNRLQVLGIDLDGTPATLFSGVELGDEFLDEEPYFFNVNNNFDSDITINPIGHYREPPFTVHVNFNIDQDNQFVYNCIYDPLTYVWDINLSNERVEVTPVDYAAFTKVMDFKNSPSIDQFAQGVIQDTSKWHSINPIEDCPHVDEFVVNTDGISDAFKNNHCVHCNDSEENWYCLTCGQVYCSRYVKSHGVKHYEEAGHAILFSFSDLSTWCYLCDYYISDPSIRPALFALHVAKFGVPHPKDQTGMFLSRFYCNSCKGLIKKKLFHCKECTDYDLCETCYKSDKFDPPHDAAHNVDIRNL